MAEGRERGVEDAATEAAALRTLLSTDGEQRFMRGGPLAGPYAPVEQYAVAPACEYPSHRVTAPRSPATEVDALDATGEAAASERGPLRTGGGRWLDTNRPRDE